MNANEGNKLEYKQKNIYPLNIDGRKLQIGNNSALGNTFPKIFRF